MGLYFSFRELLEDRVDVQGKLFIGKGQAPQYLDLARANRHGLIAGATGTGKTVTLQILAEGFSAQGVPVFMADVKGDLSGISQAGEAKEPLIKRATDIGLDDYRFQPCPAMFWDVFGEQGHPVRTTVSEMGPLLLARVLDLNDTQEGVLNIAFQVADAEGMLLLDLEDLRSMLTFLGENADRIGREYGRVSSASVGAVQRSLLALRSQGTDRFFGEPALQLADFMRQTYEGRGFINVLAADRLIEAPRAYSTFLLWLLSELFEELPEVGDVEKPKLVFFFDEAHLLFNDAPKALVERVAQVVRLIRSKGIGVFFVTQNPMDLPDEVLGQLGNRVQHALRAFTPKDAKAVRAAAQTFRQNPAMDTETVITELGVGEALVSMLDEKGRPGMVERTLIRPPSSRLGPATAEERAAVMARSPVAGRYEQTVNRESAYEILLARAEDAARRQDEAAAQAPKTSRRAAPRRSSRQGVGEAFAKSIARSVGSRLGREILRGIMGSLARR